MTLQEKIAFFEKNHYLFVPNALSAKEVATLNTAIDRTLKENRPLWYGSETGRLQTVQNFLNLPEADFLIQHPSWFPVAKHALDGDIAFAEFSVMIRAGGQKPGIEGWHRDFMPNPDHRLKMRVLSAIYYTTDVDETTARYCLIPASHEVEEAPKKIREESEDREGEKQMFGPAGSVILVNSGIWHCGRWGEGPRERRTIHMYYQPTSIPPHSHHNIFPRRLWDVADPVQRKFYSHFNPLTQAVVKDYVR